MAPHANARVSGLRGYGQPARLVGQVPRHKGCGAMRQFFNGSLSAFEDLELRARRACIVFNAEEMPASAVPRQARIGFDGTASDGTVLLLVQKNVQYSGPSE